MEFPVALTNAIQQLAARYPMAQLKNAAEEISRRYRQETGRGKTLLRGDVEAAAYALARMPATFGAVAAALEYTLEATDFAPKTLLDVGAGTGAACWAADALLPLEQVTCLEREAAMRQLGQELMREGSETLQEAEWLAADLTADAPLPKAELVVASYVVGELSSETRWAVLQKLWEAAEGMLLIIEPGTPAAFAQIEEMRRKLVQRGAHIAAPCPHEQPCRLMEQDWCHFTCRVPRSRLHKLLKGGDAPYEDEKFSYLALTKFAVCHDKARILRHPQIAKGQIGLTLCGINENQSIFVKKKDGALFKIARKAKCGDAIKV